MQDHTILASDINFGTVSICPGGVVHINLQHCSLKFVPSDFATFADLIARARLNFGKRPPLGDGKPQLHLVSREPQDSPTSEPEE